MRIATVIAALALAAGAAAGMGHANLLLTPNVGAGGTAPSVDLASVQAILIPANFSTRDCGGAGGSVTTTTANEYIFVIMESARANSPAPSISSVSSSPSLTWASYTQVKDENIINPGHWMTVDVWRAFAATAGTYTITATMDGLVDSAAGVCVAVAGANTTTPMDVNASLPKKLIGSASPPSVTGVSTTATNTLLLGFAGQSSSATPCGSSGNGPVGWSDALLTNNGNGVSFWSCGYLTYKRVSSTQSSITVTYGSTWPNWAEVVMALQP